MDAVKKLELVEKNKKEYIRLRLGTHNMNQAAALIMVSSFGGQYETEEDGSVLYHDPRADLSTYIERYYKIAHVFGDVCDLVLNDVITVRQAEKDWGKPNLTQNSREKLGIKFLGEYRQNNIAITTRSAVEREFGPRPGQ